MKTDESRNDLISFRNVTLRVRDRHILAGTDWQILAGQNWAVIGANGSGKTTLLGALTGQTPVVSGNIRRQHPKGQPTAIGYVSFELQQRLIAREQDRDRARFFSGNFNDQLTAAQLLESARNEHATENRRMEKVVKTLGIGPLRDRPLRALSSGECRKILIGCAVLRSKGLLVLDEPFEGLDIQGRHQLARAIHALIQIGVQVVLATHRMDYISPEFSHVMGLKDGRVFGQGSREWINRAGLKDLYARPACKQRPLDPPAPTQSLPGNQKASVLIRMHNVTVRYGNRIVFDNLNWTVTKGENWAVSGPNGSGKTTLLQMITGDHPQAYANAIYLFGHRRGSGESIWEIKHRMGLVSSEFQLGYRKPIRAYNVVVSGFFDSVGLYRRANAHQHQAAHAWIARLGLMHLQERRFDLLSYGERRLVLLARAMVKAPELLVLDEPCQGLDPGNRRLVLERIDAIVSQTAAQLLYVTHFADEIPACITHRFDLTHHRP